MNRKKKNLFRFIDEVALGETIVITRANVPVAEIVPVVHSKPKPTFGSARGLIKMSEDYDAPIGDFWDYTK